MDVTSEDIHDVREGDQSLNAGVPVLLLGSVHKIGTVEPGVSLQPLLRLNELKRIGAGGENLAQKQIRIESNRSDEVA